MARCVRRHSYASSRIGFRLSDPVTLEEASAQLLLYSSLAGTCSPKKTIRLRFVVLTKTANPTVEQHFAEINPQKLAREEDIREGVERYSGGRFLSCPERLTCSHE